MISYLKNHPLISILLLAGVIRLVSAFILGPANLLEGDFPLFDRMARNLLTQGDFGGEPALTYGSPNINPAFAFWLAFLYLIFGQSTISFFVGQVILSLLVIFGSYLFSVRLFGKKVGFMVALAMAFWPLLVLLVGESSSVLLHSALFLFSILFFFKALDGRTILFGTVSGILLGLSALTDSITFYVPVVFGIWLSGLVLYKRVALKRAFVLGTFFVLAFVAVLTPWAIRNATVATADVQGLNIIAKNELGIVSAYSVKTIFKNLISNNFLLAGFKQMFFSPYGTWILDKGPVEETIIYKNLIPSVLRGEHYPFVTTATLALKTLYVLSYWVLVISALYASFKFKFLGTFVLALLAYTVSAVIGFVSLRGSFIGVSHLSIFVVPLFPLFVTLASALAFRVFPNLGREV